MDEQQYQTAVRRADQSLGDAQERIADARRRLAAADRKYTQDVIKRTATQKTQP